MQELLVNIAGQPSATSPATNTSRENNAISGTYVGNGDGVVTLTVGNLVPGKGYQVSVTTNATVAGGGGCAGAIEAFGQLSGSKLTLTGNQDGNTCPITVSFSGNGAADVAEGQGCGYFHGAACGFSAQVTRKR